MIPEYKDKDICPESQPEKELTCYGFILMYKDGHGWVGKAYNRANPVRGKIEFQAAALRFDHNYDYRYLYAVRCTCVKTEKSEVLVATSVEEVASFPWVDGDEKVFEIDDFGQVQIRPMDESELRTIKDRSNPKRGRAEERRLEVLEDLPLTGVETLVGSRIEVVTANDSHLFGWLRAVEDDCLKLYRARNGGNDRNMVRVPKGDITRVWAYGTVDSYGDQPGMAYIGSVGFHVQTIKEEQRAYVRKMQMVRYRVVKSNKGLTAMDVVCLDEQDEEGYVLGIRDGQYLVLEIDQDGYEKPWLRQGKIHLVPKYCGVFIPQADTQDRKVSMKVYRELGGQETVRVIIWAEDESAAGEHLDIRVMEDRMEGIPLRQEGVKYAYGIAVGCNKGIVHIVDIYTNGNENPGFRTDEKPLSPGRYFELEKASVFPVDAWKSNAKTLISTCALVRYAVPNDTVEGQTDDVDLTHDVVVLKPFKKDELSFLSVQGSVLRLAYGKRGAEAELRRKQTELRQRRAQCKPGSAEEKEISEALIQCDKKLLDGTSEPSKQMHLFDEIATQCYGLGNYLEAKRYYLQWLDGYGTLKRLDPAKAKNLDKTGYFARAKKQIELCDNGGREPQQAERTASNASKAPNLFETTRAQRDPDDIVAQEKFVDGRFKGIKLEEKLSPDFGDLKKASPPPERLEELRKALESRGGETNSETQWVLARGWDALWLKSQEVADLEQRNKCLARALVGQGTLSRKHEVKYWCAWALRLDPEAEEAAARYLSHSTLPLQEQRPQESSVRDIILKSRSRQGVWGEATVEKVVRDCVLLCGFAPEAQDSILGWFRGEELAVFRRQCNKALAKALGVDEPKSPEDWNTLRRMTKQAVGDYINAIREAGKEPAGQIDDVAKSYQKYLKTAERWCEDEERTACNTARGILDKLQNYGEKSSFNKKARLLEDCGKTVEEEMKTLRERSARSIGVDHSVLLPLLVGLYSKLEKTHQTLVLTTRPSLKLDEKSRPKAVLQKKNGAQDGLELEVELHVVAGSNNTQDANSVRLECKEDPGTFTVRSISQEPQSRIIRSGEQTIFRIRLCLSPDRMNSETINLPVRLKYDYQTIGQAKGKHFERYTMHGQMPEQGYQDVTVVLDTKKRKEIAIAYYNALVGNANGISDPKASPNESEIERNAREQASRIYANRKEVCDRIMADLCRNNDCEALSDTPRWVTLYGEWRVGKTTVLSLVKGKIETKFPRACVVRFDSPVGVAKENYEVAFAQELIYALYFFFRSKIISGVDGKWWEWAYEQFCKAAERNKIDLDAVEDETADVKLKRTKRFLTDLSATLREREPNAALIFMVDEFTYLYDAIKFLPANKAFVRLWAQFCTEENLDDRRRGTGCLFITAGGEYMEELVSQYDTNAWQKTYDSIHLKYLSPDHVEKFVRFVIHRDEFFYEPDTKEYRDTMDYIFELTQGNVTLLRNLCNELIRYINGDLDSRRTINKKLLDEVMTIMAQDMTSGLFDSLVDPYREDKADEQSSEADRERLWGAKLAQHNETVLNAVVAVADSGSHKCTRKALIKRLNSMDMALLDQVIDELKRRRVLVAERAGEDEVLKIRVDLYYELVSRRNAATQGT